MYSYIARRIVFWVLTVIGVSIMVFVVMRILPGDPLVAIFGPEGLTKLTQEQRANYMAELGLSDPLWSQYLRWVNDIENNDWPPQDSQARWKGSTRLLLAGAALSPGAALVNQESCLACHALGDQGGRLGPRLEYVGARRDVDWIARYLADPGALTPGAAMPKFDKLSEAQRRAIAEFVVSLAARREP